MAKLPLMLDWKALKSLLGHPYSRTETYRKMADHECPFPSPIRLGNGPRCRVVWPTKPVLDWYRAKGLPLDVDIDTP
jgi:predicted DNA-binding transcriptional regulator AlpA